MSCTIRRMSARCLGYIGRDFGGVWNRSGGCLVSVWKIYGWYQAATKYVLSLVRSGQFRTGQVRIGLLRTSQARTAQVKSFLVRTGELRTGQVR